MSAVTRAAVEETLSRLIDPNLNADPVSAGCVRAIEIDGDRVSVQLELGYPADLFKAGWAQMLQMSLQQMPGVGSAEVKIDTVIAAYPGKTDVPTLAGVKNVIAADIYGPSQGIMLGVPSGTQPAVRDEKYFIPIRAHGLSVMSMAFLTTDSTPMVWRGPMASGALLQMITQTAWDNLDYLVVDMPPGTGDIQLTLAQKVPVAGAVIVTTPQDIALLDARKGIEMFRKVNIPILGIVENMAVHICSNCGHAEHLFGEGGGERLAASYDAELLASLPLSMAIRLQCDGGEPTASADPDSQIAMIYQQLARTVAARISVLNQHSAAMPSIEVSDD